MKWRNRERGSKMGNTRAVCPLGHSHRSQLEIAVCQITDLQVKAGELELIRAEDTLYLSRAKIKYISDFKCRDLKTNEIFWREAKGFENDRWPIIKKLWSVYGPGRLEVWKGTHRRPFLQETIIPKSDPKGEE